MGSTKKTNNDAAMLEAKVALRVDSIKKILARPPGEGAVRTIRVLDAFGGEGVLWREVKKKTKKLPVKILVLGIDKDNYSARIQLEGENTKFLLGINLQYFDIIDLDAWGTPVKQLEILRARAYTGLVHCTFIQSMYGELPDQIHAACGYSSAMVKKCRSIFNKNGREKFLQYLALRHNVKRITYYEKKRKHYLYFSMFN